MVRRRSTVRFREGARTKDTRRRSSEAEQAAHNRRVGGSSPPAATFVLPLLRSDPGLNHRALRTEELQMTHRYCPTCASEVEEVDGFCFLGHPLKLHAAPASLSELRDEVERAFADTEPAPERALVGVAARTAAAPPRAQAPAAAAPARVSSPPASSVSPGPRPALDDPIAAFAPPPRMDWGPESLLRGALRRLNPTGRHSRPSRRPN